VSLKSKHSQAPTVLEEYIDGLYSYALMLTRNSFEAEDLVQETYLRAYKAKHRLANHNNIKGWLFTILRNIWFNQLRRRRTGLETGVPDWDEVIERFSLGSQRNAYDHYLAKVEIQRVRTAIQQLVATFREVIILREYEEMSYQQIADILNCPIGTVMSRLARARLKLRELLSVEHRTSTAA
jgi:RNA polymerase sigma-70 factor, ECF subfamily